MFTFIRFYLSTYQTTIQPAALFSDAADQQSTDLTLQESCVTRIISP